MKREAALRKILACLRLARSSNPNEAAAALRQALALMEKYGLTEDDALASEIRNCGAPTGFRGGLVPQSLVALAVIVADCYRCKPVISTDRLAGKTTVLFYGGGADAEIAAYAYTVLQRQLRSAKAKHTARIRKRANKERRGEEFAAGWIHAVRKLLPDARPAGELELTIDRAIAASGGDLTKTTGRAISKAGRASADDFHHGHAAGKNAQLHSGVAGDGQRRISANNEA